MSKAILRRLTELFVTTIPAGLLKYSSNAYSGEFTFVRKFLSAAVSKNNEVCVLSLGYFSLEKASSPIFKVDYSFNKLSPSVVTSSALTQRSKKGIKTTQDKNIHNSFLSIHFTSVLQITGYVTSIIRFLFIDPKIRNERRRVFPKSKIIFSSIFPILISKIVIVFPRVNT